MSEPEIIDGLPIPPDHPRFEKHDGVWRFICFRRFESTASAVDIRELNNDDTWNQDDCRNCARCYWLDTTMETEETVPSGQEVDRGLQYAEMCRLWKL